MLPPSDDIQASTLRLYTLLAHLRPDWPGSLVLSCGLGPLGSAVALAANVAGATCLSIEPDPAVCRAAVRAGACDFLVNTVDEALRVLKNEVRQHRPLSVALELGLSAALDELLERGVLPQLFFAPETAAATMDQFVDSLQPLGMAVLDLDKSSLQLQSLLDQRNLTLHTPTFDTAAALRAFDARLQQLIPTTDPRHRWFTVAPRLFHRDRPYRRAVLLTPEERAALA